MSLRDKVAMLFSRPIPDDREALTKAAGTLDQVAARNEKAERQTATAIDAKQAELLRTHLTPELTPYGTQPLRPPSGDEARAQAEKLVTGRDRADDPATKGKAPARVEPQENSKAAPAPIPAQHDRALLQAEKVDDRTRTGPLEGETITEPYVADIVTLQAEHEVEADQQRSGEDMTPEAYEAAFAARVAEIEAEQASAVLTHTKGGGRTM